MPSILNKIESARLVGRGGAGFPTHLKWKAVAEAIAGKKYVVVNASEGELGLFKDIYILEHFPDVVFSGIKVALDFLGAKECYFNFNKKYYQKTKRKISRLIKDCEKQGYKFTIFKEEPSYIGGEETALFNAIEGKRTEPRLKPPFPTQSGLFGCPTLVHNIETLYNIALVGEDKFEDRRFYCLSGVKHPGVYHFPAVWSIEKVLRRSGNYPDFDFFVQVGGSISGIILNQKQAQTKKATGAGSIEVYKSDTDPRGLLQKWFNFYACESCGKCCPCRIGSYNISQTLKNDGGVNWKKIINLLESMEKTSFCALGKTAYVPVESYIKNVLRLKISLKQI